MKALANAPGTADQLAVVEVPEVRPADDEAVISVHASSLNRGELRLLASRPAGWLPGQDVVGIVVRQAADGSGPVVGTRVVALAEQGGWAEHVAVPTNRIAEIPDGVTFAKAATLPIAGTAALRTLRLADNLDGKRVLITGASGGVGRFQVQLAAASGAQVTAIASARNAGSLRALGADEVVSSPAEATGVFDFITDSVGGDTLGQALGKVAPRGTVVIFGCSSGQPTPIAFTQFIPGHEGASIRHFALHASGPGIDEDLRTLVGLVADDELRVDVGLEVDWTALSPAIRAMSGRSTTGKVVIRFTTQGAQE